MSESFPQLPEHLVVFTGVKHHLLINSSDHKYVAHGAFVREINIWARIFKQVLVLGPISTAQSMADAIPYGEDNIQFAPLGQYLTSINPMMTRIRMLATVPSKLAYAIQFIQPNSVIMARGPDGFGFLGYIISRLKKNKRFAKYAGQWENYSNEPRTYRFQKVLYGTPLFGGPVIVNMLPDPGRPHLVPLLNSSISQTDWSNATELIERRPSVPPFRLLFVGRITPAKGIDILIKAISILAESNQHLYLDVVGDGSEKARAVKLVQELNLSSRVNFHGWLGQAALQQMYSQAFCLVQCSRHQGLDKVLLEAMTYALPIIGTNVSVAPLVIEPPLAGILVPPDDVNALVNAISQLLATPLHARQMGAFGRKKVKGMVLEQQELRYREFLRDYLRLNT